MTDAPQAQAAVTAASVGYYHGVNAPDLILSDDENTICKLQNDGRLEIRYRGTHVRYI